MYREITPIRELQPFVECFWTSRTEGGAVSATRVLPDGCVDLIFDLTPGFETAFWVGTMTRTVVVEAIEAAAFAWRAFSSRRCKRPA